MKKILLIAIIFLALQTKAQETYLNMLDSNVVWYYKTVHEFGTDYYSVQTIGDTLIEEKYYYKLYHGYHYGGNEIYGFIREDDEGKVFIRYPGVDFLEQCGGLQYPVNQDLIFMDFGVEVGDSILNPYLGSELYYYILYVQVEEIAGQLRRRVDYGMGSWIEGIGSGFNSDFDQMFCGIGEWGTTLLCYFVNDSIVYSHDDNCLVGINESYKINLGLELFPNPASETVNISVAENVKVERIRVYEVTGRVVIEQNNQSPQPPSPRGSSISLDVSDLSPGMYLLEVETKEGMREVKRIVLER